MTAGALFLVFVALATLTAGQILLKLALADEPVTLGVSIGVAFSGPQAHTPALLLRAADHDMYRIKRARIHKQRFALSDAHRLAEPADLETDLRDAIARDELRLDYQPIVDPAGGTLVSLEALLRWEHPTLGNVPPTAIIPFAEQTGLILELGQWVLRTACAHRTRCQSHVDTELAIAVNVSAHQFMAPGFIDSVERALAAEHTPPHALTLEVTETVLVSDVSRATRVLAELRDLGVRLSLDDFGAGYSSLKYLLSFIVDHVKIDRDFVRDLARDPTSLKIVTAVIALGHDLGVTIIAEGVETSGQLAALTTLGCDYCQGYYFGRPMPADDVQAQLRLARRKTPSYPASSSAPRPPS